MGWKLFCLLKFVSGNDSRLEERICLRFWGVYWDMVLFDVVRNGLENEVNRMNVVFDFFVFN